jgi:translation initiation factor IF-1
MAREDLISADGKVIDVTGGSYHVQLDNGQQVSARLSGRMKKFKIRVLVGDRVTIAVSPYDLSHGLITHRLRL